MLGWGHNFGPKLCSASLHSPPKRISFIIFLLGTGRNTLWWKTAKLLLSCSPFEWHQGLVIRKWVCYGDQMHTPKYPTIKWVCYEKLWQDTHEICKPNILIVLNRLVQYNTPHKLYSINYCIDKIFANQSYGKPTPLCLLHQIQKAA